MLLDRPLRVSVVLAANSNQVPLVDEGLVDGGCVFGLDVDGAGHELEHEDDDEVAFGVDLVGGSVGAAPAEGADFGEAVGAEAVDGLEAESEAEAGGGVERTGL